MLFTGTFARAVDDKLRIAIPKPLRSAFEAAGGTLYVTPGTDGSLAIYTEAALDRLASRLSASSPTSQDVRAFSRLFYSQAQAGELDAQGRLRIPAELAKLARLDKEVVLIGVQDHLELWDRSRWESYAAAKQTEFDLLAESAFRPPA